MRLVYDRREGPLRVGAAWRGIAHLLGSGYGASGWLLLATAVAAVLAYASVTFTARLLGPVDFGLVGALAAVASIATVALTPLYGMAAHIASTALLRREPQLLSGLTGPTLAGALVLGLLALAGWLVWREPSSAFFHASSPETIALLSPWVAALACVQVLKGFLSGLQRFTAFAFATVVEALVRAVLTVPLVLLFGVFGALAAYVGGVVAADAWALKCLGRIGWRLPAREQFVAPGRAAASTALVMLVIAVLQNSDLVLLRWYATPENVGMYAAAAALGNTLFSLAVPLTLPAYPRALAAYRGQQPTWPILRGALVPVGVGGMGATVGAIWLGVPVAAAIFGSAFPGVGQLLPLYIAKTTALIVLALIGQHAVAVERPGALGAGAALALAGPVVLALVKGSGPTAAAISFGVAAAAAALVGLLLVFPSRLQRRGAAQSVHLK